MQTRTLTARAAVASTSELLANNASRALRFRTALARRPRFAGPACDLSYGTSADARRSKGLRQRSMLAVHIAAVIERALTRTGVSRAIGCFLRRLRVPVAHFDTMPVLPAEFPKGARAGLPKGDSGG